MKAIGINGHGQHALILETLNQGQQFMVEDERHALFGDECRSTSLGLV